MSNFENFVYVSGLTPAEERHVSNYNYRKFLFSLLNRRNIFFEQTQIWWVTKFFIFWSFRTK